jgi:ADP-ribosylglycohydrolase
VSALTHPRFRAAMACFIYIKIIEKIIEGRSIGESYRITCHEVLAFWNNENFSEKELMIFETVLSGKIGSLEENSIRSGGYVMHTLEASIWVLLNTSSYEEAVLKSVNLGDDTDTTAAVTGGVAGLVYGKEGFPEKWYSSTSRIRDIEHLCENFATKLNITA